MSLKHTYITCMVVCSVFHSLKSSAFLADVDSHERTHAINNIDECVAALRPELLAQMYGDESSKEALNMDMCGWNLRSV